MYLILGEKNKLNGEENLNGMYLRCLFVMDFLYLQNGKLFSLPQTFKANTLSLRYFYFCKK